MFEPKVNPHALALKLQWLRQSLMREARNGRHGYEALEALWSLEFVGLADPVELMGWRNEAAFLVRRHWDRMLGEMRAELNTTQGLECDEKTQAAQAESE